MKVFAAGLQTETNTFSPWPTGFRAFATGGTSRGDAVLAGTAPEHATARLWRDLCLRDAHQFDVGLFAYAEPSGPTVQSVYESFREEILEVLRARDGVDIVLLFARRYDCCRVRGLRGRPGSPCARCGRVKHNNRRPT